MSLKSTVERALKPYKDWPLEEIDSANALIMPNLPRVEVFGEDKWRRHFYRFVPLENVNFIVEEARIFAQDINNVLIKTSPVAGHKVYCILRYLKLIHLTEEDGHVIVRPGPDSGVECVILRAFCGLRDLYIDSLEKPIQKRVEPKAMEIERHQPSAVAAAPATVRQGLTIFCQGDWE